MLSQLSKEHPSVQRNPLIAHVFYLCGKIEKWGRGTLDMIKDCRRAGNPPPKYEEVGGSFSVTFPFKESLSSTPHFTEPFEPLTDRQKEIVTILIIGPMSTEQIVAKMQMPPTLRMVQLSFPNLKNWALSFLQIKNGVGLLSGR